MYIYKEIVIEIKNKTKKHWNISIYKVTEITLNKKEKRVQEWR